MKYNFDDLASRKNSSSYKWDYKENALPMWVADMDFKSPDFIYESLKKRLDIRAYGYTFVDEEFYSSITKWWLNRHQVSFKRDWMIYSSGIVAAISSMVRSLTKEGDNVLVISPIYNIFFNSILNNKRKAVEYQLEYQDNEYHIDFSRLEKTISDNDIRLLIFCNPQNPTGNIWNKEEIKKIGELAKKFNFLVISDEIHCDITDPNYSYTPFISVKENEDISITCISSAKVFNLAGLQASCLVIPNKEIRDRVNRGLNNDEVAEPNFFSIAANIAAFKKGEEYVNQLNEYIYHNKQYLYSFIRDKLPKLKVVEAHSLYLVWVDISSYSHDSVSFTNDLFNKTGLFVSEGNEYHGNGHDFIRINVATSLENIKEGCNCLYDYIQSLK